MSFHFPPPPPCSPAFHGPIGPHIVGDFGWGGLFDDHRDFDGFNFGFLSPAIPLFTFDGGHLNINLPLKMPHLNPTAIFTTLPTFMTDGHGHAPFGSGNPAAGYEVQHSIDGGLDVVFGAQYRQGNMQKPTVDSHGTLQFYFPDGQQVVDPAHGVFANNANRDVENFNYGFGAKAGHTLSEYDIHMKIGYTDAGGHKTSIDLHMVPAPAGNPGGSKSGMAWEDAAHHQFYFGDGGGSPNQVEFNSEQFRFIGNVLKSNGVAYSGQDGVFDLELSAVKHDDIKLVPFLGNHSPVLHESTLVADIHAEIHVVSHNDAHIVHPELFV